MALRRRRCAGPVGLRRRQRRLEQRRRAAAAAAPSFNAAIGQGLQPVRQEGRHASRSANSGDWDSPRPGRHLLRLLVELRPPLRPRRWSCSSRRPGDGSDELVPDLAERLGEPSDGGKTWTYTLRKGVKFEDGTPITSKDVKYAVERSIDKDDASQRPDVLRRHPRTGRPATRARTRTRAWTTRLGDRDPGRPDDRLPPEAAVRRLRLPRQLPQTVPVPQAKDTGAKYKEHVVSTGPYKFETYEPGKSFTLVRNTEWDPATDPNRKALPDKIDVKLNVNADDIDNRLLAGDLDVDIAGTGVQPAAQGRVLGDPNAQGERRQPDAGPRSGTPRSTRRSRRSTTSTAARPSSTRIDHDRLPDRLRRPIAGGDIATTLLPPLIPGYQKFDLYPADADNKGDVGQGQGGADAVRPAERLRDQHLLPGRAPEGEGDRRGAAAVAGQGRHQADAQALPAGRLLHALRRQARLRRRRTTSA